MFMIYCETCGRQQHWAADVTPGADTLIEVANHAVHCICGAGVEEDNGRLVDYASITDDN